jgi:hypothetical protein
MLGPGFEDARSEGQVNAILGGHSRGIIPRYFSLCSLFLFLSNFFFPRIMEAVFDKTQNERDECVTRFAACYIEIYRETLFDLLARTHLKQKKRVELTFFFFLL